MASVGDWIAIIGAAAIIFAPIGYAIKYLLDKYMPGHKDTIDEWKELTNKTQDVVEKQQTRINALEEKQNHQVTDIVSMKIQILECDRDKARLEVIVNDTRNQLLLQQSTVQRLQALVTVNQPTTNPVPIVPTVPPVSVTTHTTPLPTPPSTP